MIDRDLGMELLAARRENAGLKAHIADLLKRIEWREQEIRRLSGPSARSGCTCAVALNDVNALCPEHGGARR